MKRKPIKYSLLTAADRVLIRNIKRRKRKPDYSCWKEWQKTLPWNEFLKFVKSYNHLRVGTGGKMFFRVTKKEIKESVRTNRAEVTFDVMVNPNIPNDIGVMFIHKVRCTLLDK